MRALDSEFLIAVRYNPVIRTALFATVAAFLVLLVYRLCIGRRRAMNRLALRATVGALSLVYALVGAELGLQLFFAESHGSLATLASARWFKWYWKPINADGFRDRTHTAEEIAGKRLLGIVGDSFAAGHGIKRTDDRFGDLLASMLGPEWRPMTLAMPGWGTDSQAAALTDCPYRFDAMVLQYFINDIHPIAMRAGVIESLPQRMHKPPLLRSWINRSSLVNLMYSRWYAASRPTTSTEFWLDLNECFDRDAIWTQHRQDLRRIIEWCAQRGTELYVVLIPALQDVARSRPYLAKVAEVFHSHGCTVLDMSVHLMDRDAGSLVVNPVDAHANEMVHREIARLLYKSIDHTALAHFDRID